VSCDARLEEYIDGELDAAGVAAVEAHLAGCAACREELDGLRRLERVLRSVPAGAPPEAERYVRDIRERAARRKRGLWLSAAAAALFALAVLPLAFPPVPVDVHGAVAEYARHPSSDVEARVRGWGRAALPGLEALLDHHDVRVQFAAASLLFKVADEPARQLVLARFQRSHAANGGWTLGDIGAEPEDSEMVSVAISYVHGGRRDDAVRILKKLNRLHEGTRHRVAEAVVELLRYRNPKVQKLALEIAREADVEFPLSAVVDLLGEPELGDEALKVLRQAARGLDFGRDAAAWREWAEQQKEE
jgi:hypothetical protein